MKRSPKDDPDILYKFINPYDPDANEEWTTAFSIQTKLHTALAELSRPHGTGNPLSLDIPFNEMKANPDVCRRYEAELSKLLQLIQDRIPKGPFDPTALEVLNLRRVAKKITAVMEATKTTSIGKNRRNQQSKVAKGRGKQQTEAREPEWTKWQTAANKVWKKQKTWGAPMVAKQISSMFPDVEEDTIRKRIKKPSM